jgi:hypothetical protein
MRGATSAFIVNVAKPRAQGKRRIEESSCRMTVMPVNLSVEFQEIPATSLNCDT